MGKKRKFIKIMGISTAIAVSQIRAVAAQEVPQTNDGRNTTEDIEEIIKPAQPAIPNTDNLNPSGNPLSFPTTPEEVEVDDGDRQSITLEQALELSLRNNKEIEQARLEVERSQFELRQERAALYPNLDLDSSITYGNDLFLDSITEQRIDDEVQDGIEDSPDVDEDALRDFTEDRFGSSGSASFDYSGSIGVTYNIFTGGRRGASIRSAEKQLRSEELDLERIVEETRLETANDYYELQNNDAQVEIQQAAVEDAQQTLRDAQLLERAGLGTRFDVLRAEVELAQAEQRLTTANANQSIARRQLAETLSVSHSTQLTTADAIEEAGAWEMGLPETIVMAFKNRAELEQFLLQREISQEQRTIALSATRPQLSANAAYTTSDDFEDDFDISDSYSVGLSLQWRLFDGGAARAAANQAETDEQIAETQFANQRDEIRFAVEQAFFQLESNLNNIATARRSVELAEESLRLARLRFQAGVGTQTDVIEAQTSLTTERGNLLSSITDYNQSLASLNRQVSNTPDSGLQDLP